MNEEVFNAALDQNPKDWGMRLVFADWLEERGDQRAGVYRLMGEKRIAPARHKHLRRINRKWPWVWQYAEFYDKQNETCLPKEFVQMFQGDGFIIKPVLVFPSRFDAENALIKFMLKTLPFLTALKEAMEPIHDRIISVMRQQRILEQEMALTHQRAHQSRIVQSRLLPPSAPLFVPKKLG